MQEGIQGDRGGGTKYRMENQDISLSTALVTTWGLSFGWFIQKITFFRLKFLQMAGCQIWKRTQSYSQGPHFARKTSEAQKSMDGDDRPKVIQRESQDQRLALLGHEILFLFHPSFLKEDTSVPEGTQAQNAGCRDLSISCVSRSTHLLEICFCSQIAIHLLTHAASIYGVSSQCLKGFLQPSKTKSLNSRGRTWVLIHSPQLMTCMTLGTFLYFSKPV